MLTEEFLKGVDAKLSSIGFSRPSDSEKVPELYRFVEEYATANQLYWSSVSLPVVYRFVSRIKDDRKRNQFDHVLNVAKLLLDLYIGLEKEEGDILLAASLCQYLLGGVIREEVFVNQMNVVYGFDPAISRLVMAAHPRDAAGQDTKEYCNRIKDDRLALLLGLADRAELIAQIHSFSSWEARGYIMETRNCFFPICIYAREHYPELLGALTILSEKMKCLIDVSSILLSRYEARERELNEEILALKEENALIKSILTRVKA